jgi:hypothetical protein
LAAPPEWERSRIVLISPRRAILGLAVLGASVGVAASPSAAMADGLPVDPAPASVTTAPVAARVPGYVDALQPNGWYCAPAATRIALSNHGILPSFDDLAAALGTTYNGTKSIFEVTRVLNGVYGTDRYHSVEIRESRANVKQVRKLRTNVVRAINHNDIVVANVIGTVNDTAGERHSYPDGHYLTITGYTDSGQTVTVTDPADRVGSNEYQLPVGVMADWIAARGYTY